MHSSVGLVISILCILAGGITLPNPASVALHESFGFEPVGVYRRIGWKFGAWHDVGWWQLQLRDPAELPPPCEHTDEIDAVVARAAEAGPSWAATSTAERRSLLCRAVGGFQFWTLQRIAVWCLLLLLGVWVISALRGRSILSWDAFAFVCALSAMSESVLPLKAARRMPAMRSRSMSTTRSRR